MPKSASNYRPMTSDRHRSRYDKIAEAARKVQGERVEPTLPPDYWM